MSVEYRVPLQETSRNDLVIGELLSLKYESVPDLLYILGSAYPVDYLSADELHIIQRSENIPYANQSAERFAHFMQSDQAYYKAIWTGEHVQPTSIVALRTQTGIKDAQYFFTSHDIDLNSITFLGGIPPQEGYTVHYTYLFHGPESVCYVVQVVPGGAVKTMRIPQEAAKHIARDIVQIYGPRVWGALQSFVAQ
jgi:hypothetical protein